MNLPRKFVLKTSAVAVALLMPLAAYAHKPWLEPSKTVLAVGQWVTIDAAVSTEPFIKDHTPMRLDALVITAPDGSKVEPENAATGKLRSTFDLQAKQAGTYKIALLNGGMNASWEEDGKTKRWPQRGQVFNLEAYAKEVPAGAKNLKVSQSIGRIETYVTAGAPGGSALKPSGRGLELVAVTGFNDLYVGEAATLQFLLDGKPAKDVDVELIADGIRYRNAIGEVAMKTDDKGQIVIDWKQPGLYYLSASVKDEKGEKPAKERRSSYTGIFEVLSP